MGTWRQTGRSLRPCSTPEKVTPDLLADYLLNRSSGIASPIALYPAGFGCRWSPQSKRRQQVIRMLGVAHHRVEIDHRVKVSRGANPRVHRYPVGLAPRPWMVVVRSRVRRDGGAVNAQPVRMCARDDLLVRRNHTLHQSGMLVGGNFAVARQSAQVVHALEDDHPAHAGRRQHVAIEPRQHIRPQPIREQMIAADSLVRHADIPRLLLSLQPRGQ